ncbi:antibiotic biosynthesis monooxygenase [bacterium]|nr:antibiotic biosynthesis monooxygenase [bacterium]
MFVFLLKIVPAPRLRQQIVEMLRSVEGPTSAMQGNLGCEIYEGIEDEQRILYIERWKSEADARPHIQSSIFERILAAMDLAAEPPEIKFIEGARTWGMELVKEMRTTTRS